MKQILLLLALFFSHVGMAQSPWYFGTGEAVNLTNGIKYKNGIKNIAGSVDPTSVAVSGDAGSIYLSTSGDAYIKQDAGLTTNWTPIGGGVSSINGQTGTAITIASGTTGSDVNVAASGNTVTVHVPTASGSVRGALSSSDWTTFTDKVTGAASSTTDAIMTFSDITGKATQNGVATLSTAGVLAAVTQANIAGAAQTGASANGAVNVTQTWDTSGTPTAIKLNVTNTNSNAASLLLDLQTGGVSKLKTDVSGTTSIVSSSGSGSVLNLTSAFGSGGFTIGGGNATRYTGSGSFGIAGGSLVMDQSGGSISSIFTEGTQQIGIRSGVTPSIFRVYNTYTSSTNYERGKLEWSSNIFNIGTEKGSGGGTARGLALQTDGTTRMSIDSTGIVNVAGLTASLPVKTNASKDLISAAIDLSGSEVTSTLPVGKGGTGATTLAGANIVTNSGSSTDNALVRWDSTTGKLVQNNTQATLSDTGSMIVNPDSGSIGLLVYSNGTATNAPQNTFLLKAKTTADMIDGHGSALIFQNEDSGIGATNIASMYVTRDGADNSGKIAFNTQNAGSFGERMRITSAGLINISGLTASLPVQTDGSKNLVSAAIDLSGSQVTSTLPVGKGGTGATTLAGASISTLTTSTWASLPAANSVTAYLAKYFVTDFPGGAQEVYSDGTDWKTTNISILGFTREAGTNTFTSTSEVIVKNYLFPAGFFKVGDNITLSVQISKDNSSNSQNSEVRMGTAGTTSDTSLLALTTAVTANAMNIHITPINLHIASATTVEVTQSAALGLTTTTRTITIPNISNALYLDLGMRNATTTGTTVSLEGYSLTVIK